MKKKRNYVRIGMLLVLLGIIMSSCQKEQDSSDPRDVMVNTWKCKEVSQEFGESVYYVDISKATDDSAKVWIDNFYNLKGFKVYARMNGLNLTIPTQTVDGNIIKGTGVISSNYKTINWTYSVNIGSGTGVDVVTASYSEL